MILLGDVSPDGKKAVYLSFTKGELDPMEHLPNMRVQLRMMNADLEKGRELLKIADEKGLYLGVAPDTVLGAGVQTARHTIDSGLIGEVTSCVASINRNQPLNSEFFRFLRGDGGALPYDVGIYYVAALTALLGPVEEVQAYGVPAPVHPAEMLSMNGQDAWQIHGNNLLAGCMKFKSGAVGTVHFNSNTAGEEKQLIYSFYHANN